MSSMVLKVEFLAGTSLECAVAEARQKATVLGLAYVSFNFNGIDVNVLPQGHQSALTIKQAVERYQDQRIGGFIIV